MQINPPEEAPAVGSGNSFGPERNLLARATWGRGEWFVRCSGELLAIQLGPPRSMRLRGAPYPILTLEPSEISLVRKGIEVLALPDGDGSFVRGSMVYLDLHLRHSRTEGLIETLRKLGPCNPARDTVQVLGPGLIRLIWQGPYHRMSPSADRAIDLIRSAAGVRPETQPRPVDWQDLSEEELSEYLLQLQDAGHYDEATDILRKRNAREHGGPTEYVHRPTASA
ncbi:MAG: hypothetical protein GY725_05415 [bacterium]|nr:hypothetical protein [bacterium]